MVVGGRCFHRACNRRTALLLLWQPGHCSRHDSHIPRLIHILQNHFTQIAALRLNFHFQTYPVAYNPQTHKPWTRTDGRVADRHSGHLPAKHFYPLYRRHRRRRLFPGRQLNHQPVCRSSVRSHVGRLLSTAHGSSIG